MSLMIDYRTIIADITEWGATVLSRGCRGDKEGHMTGSTKGGFPIGTVGGNASFIAGGDIVAGRARQPGLGRLRLPLTPRRKLSLGVQ